MGFSITLLNIDSFAEKNVYFDSVEFIQYSDENTALEEVRNGNLDIYYDRIPSERLESTESREGLKVFNSAGGSFSILVNPAESDKFNPFSIKEIRFALNYLVDRKLIVNELMGGYGAPMIANYGSSDPEYLTILEELESYNFRYNPTLANEIISSELAKKGAIIENGIWKYEGNPIEIIIFIRSDDPVRKSIGEILSTELEKIGFTVIKDFGDLNKAFVVVYGSDPSEVKWNLYTEGWARSAFVKYDSVGLAQMYSPWFSNMPGFNDPTYWNYKNDSLDNKTQKIYSGDFKSDNERDQLIKESVKEGVNESVRIFLASKVDRFVANEKVEGMVNDLGAGISSRFTPINSKSDEKNLIIGIKQIDQGAWNPIGGLSDKYSRQIWGIISDPVTFPHPFTGKTFPVRANWEVETAGPEGKLNLPNQAIIWDPLEKKWKNVLEGSQATSKVRLDFKFSKWHNGQKMDMNDILYSLYFAIEWGTQTDENDKTFDTEYTPRAAESVQTIVGVNPIDEDTIDVYVDFWHFDEGEIADWASLWSSMPWEITASMEQAVIDGKVSFSRSGATSKSINWLSLISPNDAQVIKSYLDKFNQEKYIPAALNSNTDFNYFSSRYDLSSEWIKTKNHAVISNGPFFLETYSPESRTITTKAFDDETYPFKLGYWSEFEKTEFPNIKNVRSQDISKGGENYEIEVETTNADSILYFLTNSTGKLVSSKSVPVNGESTKINIAEEDAKNLSIGANDLKLFAISNSVLKPDYYSKSFLVTEAETQLPKITQENLEFNKTEHLDIWWILLIIISGIIIIAIKKKTRKITQINHNP
jgi:peptide/nickel transport system substrate-binding protein